MGLIRGAFAGIGALLVGLLAAAPAVAAPACSVNPPQTRTVLSGQGTLESVIADSQGRLYFTSTSNAPGTPGKLLKLGRTGAQPKVLVDGIESPGGLAFLPSGKLLVGFGNRILGGVTGNVNPQAGLLKVDPKTGQHSTYATGLTMANGVARGPNGAIYASNDFGLGIDRVLNGQVRNRWAQVISSNGLAVDRAGKYLYAAQTFQPAAIQRIEIAHPGNVTPFFTAGAADITAGLDGMTRDRGDNLYVAANGAGQVWRVGSEGVACVLSSGHPLTSAVALGHGAGRFESGNLYAVSFLGELYELAGARESRP